MFFTRPKRVCYSKHNRRARPTLSLYSSNLGGTPSKIRESNPSGRQPVAGYFRLSMYVKSPIKKVPNAKMTIIVWKVSIGTTPFRGHLFTTTSCAVQAILYQKVHRMRWAFSIGVMLLIEMDESEYLYSDFTDQQLRQIENLLGPGIRDKLLIPPALFVGVRVEIEKDRAV